MSDEEIFEKTVRRIKNTWGTMSHSEIIICLAKEIDCYRNKINCMQAALDEKSDKIKNLKTHFSELEEIRENAVGEIIKALSDNGYDNITISAFKSEVIK